MKIALQGTTLLIKEADNVGTGRLSCSPAPQTWSFWTS